MARRFPHAQTPLSGIAASTELLVEEGGDLTPGELNELVETIRLSTLHLQTLVENLLESTTIEAGCFQVHRRPINLQDVVQDTANLMSPLLKRRNQDLVLNIPEGLPTLWADANRLTQVLVNLLSNASKFSPMGGKIELNITEDPDRMTLAVLDSGPGLPTERFADLFKRFVTANQSHDTQYGIGLYRAETFAAPPLALSVATAALHQDVIELPNGDLVGLSIERRWIEDYPSSETDPLAPPAPAWVAGDVVVEFDPDGAVVAEFPLLDLLEPRRIGYDAVEGGYWEDFGPWLGDDIKDWSHANALSYDPASDTLLVGLRHQDAIVRIDRGTDALAWVVAPPAGWPPGMDGVVLDPAEGQFEEQVVDQCNIDRTQDHTI